MKIILATNNQNKVVEIKKILNIRGLKILSLTDFPQKIKILENGATFEKNSSKKAVGVSQKFNMIAVADDSGLCVDALGGAPGVKSARFVPPPATTQRLCKKLLSKLKNVPEGRRGAFFVCAVAIAFPSGRVKVVEGRCNGTIAFEMKGEEGFGYDPVFIPSGFDKTFAEMTLKEKNRLSHRGRAFAKAKGLLSAEK